MFYYYKYTILNNKLITSIDNVDKKLLISPKQIVLGYLTQQKLCLIETTD